MTRRHTPLNAFKQACEIAQANNMFVVDKGGHFLVYRKTPARNVCIAECRSTDALYAKVNRCASTKEQRTRP
jgi:hypothetical protein